VWLIAAAGPLAPLACVPSAATLTREICAHAGPAIDNATPTHAARTPTRLINDHDINTPWITSA
jgi:hypothetical protein